MSTEALPTSSECHPEAVQRGAHPSRRPSWLLRLRLGVTMTDKLDYDAIIIGAGISGLYQLHLLRKLGMKVRVFETGTGVGGTWYWNRYPGARFDSESYSYGYSFSQELLDEWHWTEHFSPQPQTLKYLNHVADKFDLRRDIQFRSRVTAAHWHEDTRSWEITLEDGSKHTCRFLITAIGPLSAPTMPKIDGIESFKGQSCHTARWPHEDVQGAGELRRQARGGDRHRRHGGADHPGSRQDGGPSHGVPAHAQLVRAPAQRPDLQGRDGRDPRALSGDLRALPRDLRLLPALARSPQGHRGDGRGARGAVGEALRQPRLRHVAGQLPRHTRGPHGQRDGERLRRPQDPPARERPGGGREADPHEPWLRHPPRAARDQVLRGLQPAQREAGRHQGNADRAHHAHRTQDQRRRLRVRHHHLCHGLRRHHRRVRPHRLPEASTGSSSRTSGRAALRPISASWSKASRT